MNRLRREKMRKHITEQGSATVGELKKLFPEVSVMTIHRDLDYLELNGLITRVRGGALASMTTMEPVFTERERENSAAKDLIAQKVDTDSTGQHGVFRRRDNRPGDSLAHSRYPLQCFYHRTEHRSRTPAA